MFSSKTLADLDRHAQSYRTATPFKHVVIEDFLEPDVAQGMLEAFPGFDARYALNEMGEVGAKAVRTAVRGLGPVYSRLDDFIQSSGFLQAISRITGIPDLLYDPDYEGGGTHENRQGQGLDAHIDFNYHPRTGWHRRLNLIVYLNPEWEAGWGGALQLHRDPWVDGGEVQEVLPLINRCVVFETNEISWHGFQAIDLPANRRALSRKSFAIYLYTAERPSEETAAPHATVYVPEGMPQDIAPGEVLAPELHDELRARFARMRGQLRFLYQRELEFTAQIERLKQALAEAQRAQRSPIEGYARTEAVAGAWPDGWFGSRASIAFVPSRAVRGLEAVFWAPPAIAEQTIALRWEGQSAEVQLRGGQRHQVRLPLAVKSGVSVLLEMRAERAWTPASDGSSSDQRALAYRVLGLTLEHG